MGFFYFSFLGFGTYINGVGFILGDLSTVSTGAGASMLITSRAVPLETSAPPILAVSPGMVIMLRINLWYPQVNYQIQNYWLN